MTAWRDVETAAPECAERVRALFDARKHKTIATVRADGSPRISGIESEFDDGELVFGSMPNARPGAVCLHGRRTSRRSACRGPPG